ncbi:MAG TPA: O-acetyl-ADP-ribose deacetylase [Bacillota bacterium]|nr:O-acetyl-ADP-ribose deacetylase [Bacillota bacterium]
MQVEINGNVLKLMTGDLTKQDTDIIVNAANGSLLGGGGVDGAIHRAAGKELVEACKRIRKDQLNSAYLPTGEAVITKGYNLSARYVIHTVGPVWKENAEQVDQLLANSYQNSLQLALDNGAQSISFPSISTGAYRFPVDQAATIALTTIIEFLQQNHFGTVVLTLFSASDYAAYEAALKHLLQQ